MARVDFYHMTRDAAPVVVARLAERAVTGGARLLIVAAEAKLRDAIDATLWTTNAESFLPHVMLPQPGDVAVVEPILIAADIPAERYGAALVALADGVWRDEALTFDRALYLFDGQAIDDARAAWRVLSKRDDGECHYWRQDGGGRWVKGP